MAPGHRYEGTRPEPDPWLRAGPWTPTRWGSAEGRPRFSKAVHEPPRPSRTGNVQSADTRPRCGRSNTATEADLLAYLAQPPIRLNAKGNIVAYGFSLFNPLRADQSGTGDYLSNYLGKSTPDWQGSFGVSATIYKNFELGALFGCCVSRNEEQGHQRSRGNRERQSARFLMDRRNPLQLVNRERQQCSGNDERRHDEENRRECATSDELRSRRHAVEAVHLRGESQQEYAAANGISQPTVSRMLAEAIQLMRNAAGEKNP